MSDQVQPEVPNQTGLTAAERTLRARRAAHIRWANTEPARASEQARQRIAQRFEREADPDGELEPAERARRAEHLKHAYFADLSLKSAKARRKKAG